MSQPTYQPAYHSASQPRPGATSGPKLYRIQLVRHTGMLVMWQNRVSVFTGTYDQCIAAYKAAQRHCLAFGWWSITSLIVMNWVSLVKNAQAKKKLDVIAASS